MNVSKVKVNHIFTFIIAVCGFMLFLEWLYYPIKMTTDISHIHTFMIYGGICFLLSLTRIKWWIGWLIKGFGIVIMIHFLYLEDLLFFGKEWRESVYREIVFNWNVLTQLSLYNSTPIFRTILFMLIIWMMSYIVWFLLLHIRRPFAFVVLTFVYIGVYDAFTTYNGKYAVIRTFVFGLLVIGLSHFLHMTKRETLQLSNLKRGLTWMTLVVLTVLFSTVIGYASPKLDPQWKDPVQTFSEMTGIHINGARSSKSGYGERDDKLGGSFQFDHSPIFTATTEEQQYWRIESKETYTGKGWEKSPRIDLVPFSGFSINGAGIEITQAEATIEFNKGKEIPKLVYPYGVTDVYAEEELEFLTDKISEEIHPYIDGEHQSLQKYEITFNEPTFPIHRMEEENENQMTREFAERYLQLPERLPIRIYQLAFEITKEMDNPFQKAQAIENYFHESGFTYETEDIPYPAAEQDYVDQFLFETRKGYCDNFSTAMVVMLRTLDIPARWVKGFSSGEKINEIEVDGKMKNIYEVTNANAHSWVEVYVANYGWIPFEPTKGFTNVTQFYYGEEEIVENEADEIPSIAPDVPNLREPELPEIDDFDDMATTELDGVPLGSKDLFKKVFYYSSMTLAILAVLTFFIYYRHRFYFQEKFILWKWRKQKGGKAFHDAYHHLLARFKYHGIVKEPNVTLREFAEQIDWQYGLQAMVILTHNYERVLYSDEKKLENQDELIALWKHIIDEFS